ncbi:hypothetical protein DEJ45_09675 [Streptomyces venezuelae]|nr:hypothetical protein DEJ45_09675 [Streptomyces venezuelae]
MPSRTPPETRAPELLTDRTAARPIPPGARGDPIPSAALEPPPLFQGGRLSSRRSSPSSS